jgi:hypothetical protein
MDWNYTKFEYYLITKEESKVEIKFTSGNDLTTYMIIPQKDVQDGPRNLGAMLTRPEGNNRDE